MFSPLRVLFRIVFPIWSVAQLCSATAVSVGNVVITESAITDIHCSNGVDTTTQTSSFEGASKHRVATDRTVCNCSSAPDTASSTREIIRAAAGPVVTDRPISDCPPSGNTAAYEAGIVASNRAVSNRPATRNTPPCRR